MNGQVVIDMFTSHATIVDYAYVSVPRMSHTYWGSVGHIPILQTFSPSLDRLSRWERQG
jgi:hypothetical protein